MKKLNIRLGKLKKKTDMSKDVFHGVGIIFAAVIIIICWALLWSLPIMWLWNWIMPGLLGVGKLTWLKAWGLTILVNLIFNRPTAKTD